ncbi:hypothetical protein B0H13DRAFT_2364957 [Mycena leptocephala]|nr:hypothetical protein B0H13DRAFT_2364957 [Mycena leptocephala]
MGHDSGSLLTHPSPRLPHTHLQSVAASLLECTRYTKYAFTRTSDPEIEASPSDPDDLVPFSLWDPVDHLNPHVVAIHMGTHTSAQRASASSKHPAAYALTTSSSSAHIDSQWDAQYPFPLSPLPCLGLERRRSRSRQSQIPVRRYVTRYRYRAAIRIELDTASASVFRPHKLVSAPYDALRPPPTIDRYSNSAFPLRGDVRRRGSRSAAFSKFLPARYDPPAQAVLPASPRVCATDQGVIVAKGKKMEDGNR